MGGGGGGERKGDPGSRGRIPELKGYRKHLTTLPLLTVVTVTSVKATGVPLRE